MKGRSISTKSAGPVDERYVLMHFADGALIDPRECPVGILTRGHWQVIDGHRLAVCLCANASSPDGESGEAQDETTRQHVVSFSAS